MTAAFILGINMFVAAIFAVAFAVVAATHRSARGAGWLAAGYAMGIVDVLLEFLLPAQGDPTPIVVGIFLSYLAALSFCLIGVAHHYRVAPPRKAMALIWGAGLLIAPAIDLLPYTAPLRALLYQAPYFVMQSLVVWVILRSGRRQALDMLLLGLTTLSALVYLARPAIGWLVGIASMPQAYMATTYAAISQSIAAITLVGLALVMLLVIMRDTAAEMVARAETDLLSGVFNRRGFEDRGERALHEARKCGVPLALVAADLDHFKAVNDGFGHAAGDRVIAHFAALLRGAASEAAIVGRLGGEEFAVLIPDADLTDGRRFAESVRAALCAADLGIGHGVTASFGVAQMVAGDSLFDLSRRADSALYRAKASGRNRVCVALGELPELLEKARARAS